jgi:eukaryotic-like serine/threonine-protein kinase
MLQAGAIVAEHLLLVRQLGSGGMGSVWVAEHTRLGGHVAVKFLSAALLDNESARSRFDREARLAARIKSQHVVQVHDHGVTKSEPAIPYIVMELLEGTDLSKMLDRDGPIGLNKACEILDQICEALTRAHDAGIVHRDIKPENVFVLNESRTFIKLLDFGVAHGKDGTLDRLTQTGLLLGTAHYMSPEQLFSGKDIDARADLWALGILCYQMLANEVPFQAETFGQLCLQVRDGSFPAVSTKVNVPPGVDQWFTKALSTDRVSRFQTAIEMGAAFRRVVAGELLDTKVGTVGAQTTGTGTVRVDKSEISRIREEAIKLGSIGGAASDGQPPPATQRFGSHSGSASPATAASMNEFVVRGTMSTGEHQALSGASNSSKLINSGSIGSNTPLADLSGSFGTEAKGVLALGPRPSESGRPMKWAAWVLAALVLGGGVLYFAGASADNPAAASIGGDITGQAVSETPVTELVKASADNRASVSGVHPLAASSDTPSGSRTSVSDAEPTADEKQALAGKAASTVSENAVTGGRAPATSGNPVLSGSPVSSGQRGPITNGLNKTPKSNDHVSSDKPSIPQPAIDHTPPTKPEPSRKPKYRGF